MTMDYLKTTIKYIPQNYLNFQVSQHYSEHYLEYIFKY